MPSFHFFLKPEREGLVASVGNEGELSHPLHYSEAIPVWRSIHQVSQLISRILGLFFGMVNAVRPAVREFHLFFSLSRCSGGERVNVCQHFAEGFGADFIL